jgi:hypothetical protein
MRYLQPVHQFLLARWLSKLLIHIEPAPEDKVLQFRFSLKKSAKSMSSDEVEEPHSRNIEPPLKLKLTDL